MPPSIKATKIEFNSATVPAEKTNRELSDKISLQSIHNPSESSFVISIVPKFEHFGRSGVLRFPGIR